MSRVRFMSPYLKGGRDTAKLSNRARYIATRPGVEVLRSEQQDQPATKKQQTYVHRLLRDFPGAEELLEYEYYQKNPTVERANAFIQQVQEDFAEPMSRMENYLDYVSHRPGVQLDGEHGLWYAGGKVGNLSQAVREVAEHTGSVWTPVVAIRREDADRLGYNDAESWRQLVCACAPEIARGYKIPLEHLRWYAAFHRKEDSVHIHMGRPFAFVFRRSGIPGRGRDSAVQLQEAVDRGLEQLLREVEPHQSGPPDGKVYRRLVRGDLEQRLGPAPLHLEQISKFYLCIRQISVIVLFPQRAQRRLGKVLLQRPVSDFVPPLLRGLRLLFPREKIHVPISSAHPF